MKGKAAAKRLLGTLPTDQLEAECKRAAEEKLQLSYRIIEIAKRRKELVPMLKEFVSAIKSFTGCAAVGIRILDTQGNIPYQAYDGFSRKFYESESLLSIKSDKCMCIYVIRGDIDPGLPFCTERGSFYMNGTTRFLATISEEEKGETRNVCNEYGYESVALVPIELKGRTLGLIHVADPRENMVPLKTVEILEMVALQLGIAIQRVQAEEALQMSQTELSAIYENTPMVMILVDQERRVRKVNLTAVRFAQRAAEEMIGLYGGEALRCIHSTDDPRGCGFGRFCEACPVRRVVLDTFKTGKNHYQEEAKLKFASAEEDVIVLVSTTLLSLEEGQRVLVCIEDITEHKRAEQALRESEQNFRHSLDNSPLGIRIVNIKAEGKTIYANKAILDIYGYSSIEELKSIPAVERHTPRSYAERQERVSKREAEKPVPDYFEQSIIRKDGEVRDLEVFNREVLWGGEKQFQLIYHDITERKQFEHDLKERIKELQCLYGIDSVAGKPGITLDKLCQEVVNLLPKSWQYPEITCARITIDGKEFRTENYRQTEWKQSSEIKVGEEKTGIVEISYLEPRPEIDEGPFLKEERHLIDAVAQPLRILAVRRRRGKSTSHPAAKKVC